MTQAGDADRVLIVASAGWFRCFRKEEKAGFGLGAAAEAGVIQQRLYESGGKNREIRVVFFEIGDLETMPHELGDYHRFDATEDFADLIAWLNGSAPSPALPRFPERPEPETAAVQRLIWGDGREPSLSLPVSKILLTTIGAAALSNSPIGAALDAVKEELQSLGSEVEVDDMLSIRNRFERLDVQRFQYWALIVLVRGDWGVESTKRNDSRVPEGLGPPMYFFNFSTFPLHKAVIWTTAVATVDELLEHVRRKVLRFRPQKQYMRAIAYEGTAFSRRSWRIHVS